MLMGGYWFLIYGAISGAALLSLWRNPQMRPLGWALVAAWASSNVIYEALAFQWRPILYPLIDVMIAVVARIVWVRTGNRVAGIVTLLSMVNCMVNVAYVLAVSKLGSGTVEMRYMHSLAVNIVFGAKCLIVAGWGVCDVMGWRIGFGVLRRNNRRASAINRRRRS